MGVSEGLYLGSRGAGPGRIHKSVPSYGLCQSGNATLESGSVHPDHKPQRRVHLYASGGGIQRLLTKFTSGIK